MEILILSQNHMSLCAFRNVEEVEELNEWKIYGMPGRKLLGSFKKRIRAEKVMLELAETYNYNPKAILVIPEDDDDILKFDQNCIVKLSMNERYSG